MKVKERESWVATNVGKGGKRPSFDQFNKAFKGQERNPRAQEYASQGIEEYHHYSERAEYKENNDDSKKQNQDQKQSSSKTNAIKNIAGRVAAVVVSSVIIVSTYTSMTTKVSSVNWNWSNDMQTVTVELLKSDGNVIKELPAVVTVTQKDPVCNKTGLKTYTATAEYEDDVVYTDERVEEIPALGHEHHVIEEKAENGQIIRVYECSRCHEQFTVTIDVSEED